MNTYEPIKTQLKHQTGRQAITCPSCQKNANAYVSAQKKAKQPPYDFYRNVRTACKHCKTIYTFEWRRPTMTTTTQQPLRPITIYEAINRLIELLNHLADQRIDDITEYQDKASTDMLYSLQWNAERAVKARYSLTTIQQIRKETERVAEEPDALNLILAYIDGIRQHLMDTVLNSPYDHCSTSLMSNAISEWQHAEACKMLSRSGLLDYIDNWIEFVREQKLPAA